MNIIRARMLCLWLETWSKMQKSERHTHTYTNRQTDRGTERNKRQQQAQQNMTDPWRQVSVSSLADQTRWTRHTCRSQYLLGSRLSGALGIVNWPDVSTPHTQPQHIQSLTLPYLRVGCLREQAPNAEATIWAQCATLTDHKVRSVKILRSFSKL